MIIEHETEAAATDEKTWLEMEGEAYTYRVVDLDAGVVAA